MVMVVVVDFVVVQVHVTVNYTKILTVFQGRFCIEFISPATTKNYMYLFLKEMTFQPINTLFLCYI